MEKIRRIEQKNSNIRSITGASFNTNNMLKRWDNLQIASTEMGNILTDQRNRLQQDTLRKS
jgi:histidine ammonia-lyase